MVMHKVRRDLLTYLFVWMTFAYGLAFIIITPTLPFEFGASNFYTAIATLGVMAPWAWGVVAIITVIVYILALWLGNNYLLKVASVMGAFLWGKAIIAAIIAGYFTLAASVCLANFVFWIWHYWLKT